MPETYCGKACAECAQRERLNCCGCKAGPGRQLGGDCELAKCVRTKGHETCDTCSFKGTCATRMGMGHIPENRIRKREQEIAQRTAVAERAVVLGKWLRILVLLIIFGNIANFFTNETIASRAPGMILPGKILSFAVSLASGLLYIRLRDQNHRYRTVGILTISIAILSPLVNALTGDSMDILIALFLVFAYGALGLYSSYQECTAHAEVLTGADDDLAEKWCKLWTWEIILLGVTVAGLFMMIFSPVLGAMAAFGGAIGAVVVAIMRIVYLHRTSVVFRDISEKQ